MPEGTPVPQTLEDKLDSLSRMTERILVKLFGDVEGENPNGRLPLIEAKQLDHEKRLRSLESMAFKVIGAIGLLGVLAGLVEAAAHLASVVKH